jgi:hypothetical protein
MLASGDHQMLRANYYDSAVDWAIDSLLRLPMAGTILTVVSIGVTLMLWRNIWVTGPERSVSGRMVWTMVVCVPLVGWVLYGGLGAVPKSHRAIPQSWESDRLG